jgi:hypothetical protein
MLRAFLSLGLCFAGSCCGNLPASKSAKGADRQLPSTSRQPDPSHTLRAQQAITTLEGAGIAPRRITCNGRVLWLPRLDKLARLAAKEVAKREQRSLTKTQLKRNQHVILGYMVRMIFQYIGTQNLGVMHLKGMTYRDKDGNEHPFLVFRSGITTDVDKPQSCLRSLLGPGRVKHVINLYKGSFPLHEFVSKERGIALAAGATHTGATKTPHAWRKLIETKAGYEKNKKQAMEQVASLIRQQILRPGGKAPRGNVYFHCAGGMHRSGMLFGILRRCVNKDSMALIEREYKRHTAFKSNSAPGGFERLNLRFIKEFDCALLDLEKRTPASQSKPPSPKKTAGASTKPVP